MKYTLDRPEVAFEAFVAEGRTSNKIPIGKLLPLPNATRKTLNAFNDYTKEAWTIPPKYCAFSEEHGSPVFEWKGKAIDSKTEPIGTLVSSRVPGEISALGVTVLIVQIKQADILK